jgi:hypothetical protein
MFSIGDLSAFVIALCVLMAPSGRALAQNDATYRNQVRNTLQQGTLMKQALSHNYNLLRDGYRYGYIETGKGNYQPASFHLEAGYVYLFLGACDEDCRDMDFQLIDENHQIVAEDTDSDDTPGIQFQPRRSGDYTIVATMPRCNAFIGCYWAVQALWK